jgi:hypothetical protein
MDGWLDGNVMDPEGDEAYFMNRIITWLLSVNARVAD